MRQVHRACTIGVVASLVFATTTAAQQSASAATRTSASAHSLTRTAAHTLFNTRTGAGAAPHRRLHAHEHFRFVAPGHARVPTTRVTAVRLKVTASAATRSGAVRFLPTGHSTKYSVRSRFGPGHHTTHTVNVRLGSAGRVSVRNTSSGRVHVHVWVIGYTRTPIPDRWTQSGGGPGHGWSNAGAHVTPTSLTKLRARWTTTRVDNRLVVDGGTVYTATSRPKGLSSEGGIRAASLATGKTKWTVWGTSAQKGTLTVHGGYLIVGGSDPASTVSAIRISTHRVAWTRKLTAAAAGICDTQIYALTVDAGVALALNCSGIVDAFDVASGKHLWSTTGRGRLLVAAGGRVAVYSSHGVVVASVRTGRVLWAPALATSIGVIAGSRLTFTSYDTVYSYSITGCGHAVCRPTWTAPTGYGGKVGGELPQYTASIAATEDTVAVTEILNLPTRDESRIRLFDGRTGKIVGDRRFAYADIFPHAVLAGTAVLVRYSDHVYSMPTRCHGACHLRSIYGPDSSDSPTDSVMDTYVIVGRTLIVTPATSRERTTAYTVG